MEVERESRGTFRGWRNRITKLVDVRPAAKDTTFAEFEIWQFDAGGKQTHRVACLLPNGDAAKRYARSYFAPKGSDAGRLPLITLYSVSGGETCFWIGSQGDVDCGGTICYLQFVHVRAPGGAAKAIVQREVASTPRTLSASGGTIATWNCAGGGGLSMASDGTVTYHLPPSGGGDGDGGGGGPQCGGGDGDDDDGDSGDGSVGGGDGGGATSRWGASCADSLEVDLGDEWDCVGWVLGCRRDMNSGETAAVAAALGHFKDLAAMNPQDRAFCEPLQQHVVAWFNADEISVGRRFHITTPATDHSGNVVLGAVHLDESFLSQAVSGGNTTNARKAVAVALLHEALHVTSGLSHPNGPGPDGNYSDYPFYKLPVVGENPCSAHQ